MPHSVRPLASFGDVAAEDDAVLDYFLQTDAVRKIADSEVFLVLGRKGSGKTALVRHFAERKGISLARSISLRGYPWNVHAQRTDAGASPIEAYVASWRYLICAQLASLVLAASKDDDSPEAKSLRAFFTENYGGIQPDLGTILRPAKLRLSGASFEPEVLGNKLGGVSLERAQKDLGLGVELNALSDALLNAVKLIVERLHVPTVSLHFDELDQGLADLDDARRLMLIGLILASRSVRLACRDLRCRVNPVVYLRSDLWDDLDFSDKNKISETLALSLEWDEESLLALIDARLKVRLNRSATFSTITDGALIRGSQQKWTHILNRTFLRPRDVIKFLNATLDVAKRRLDEPLVFHNEDIVAARESYSTYLKRELDDEILAHWRQWEEALQACSAISTITFERDQFTEEYQKKRSAANSVQAEQALRLLYSYSVIGYERRSGYGGSSWAFQYSDPEVGWNASASRFKVHLGLKEYARLREERR
jgi:hypothetical protein